MVLVGELFVIGFAVLVAKDLADVPGRDVAVAGGVLALLCLVAVSTLRSPAGYALGWLLQVLLVVSAAWVPLMAFVGLLFAVLWVTALVQGGRADALTARRQSASHRPLIDAAPPVDRG